MNLDILFGPAAISPLPDGDYFAFVRKALENARHRCLCSIFIVDHDLENDRRVRVEEIFDALANANWRGVDTKLVIGGSRTNRRILDVSLFAFTHAKDLGLDVKLAAATENNNSHVKLVIADDLVIIGSHNWSRSMFGGQTQDSVLVKSAAFAAKMSNYFHDQWSNLSPENYVISF